MPFKFDKRGVSTSLSLLLPNPLNYRYILGMDANGQVLSTTNCFFSNFDSFTRAKWIPPFLIIFKKLLGPHKELEFVAWVGGGWNSDSKWGHIVPNNTPYALTRKKGELSKIFTTFRGALMTLLIYYHFKKIAATWCV